MKKSFFPALAVVVLLLLLTHPLLSFEGASHGLLLWYQTVLPTLLPFMICSNVIVSLGGIRLLTAPVRPLLKNMLCLSDAGSYVLISGLLCGYPMGAKTCSEFVEQGRITPSEGRYLLSVSNHPSPMFLLGYVASALSPSVPTSMILTALYVPILPIAFLSQAVYGIHEPCVSGPPKDKKAPSFDQSMMASFEVMVKIGGYIMLFSILAQWIQTLPLLSLSSRALLTGMAEITTGIHSLCTSLPAAHTALPVICATAFGGLSGIFQTKSVIKDSGLSICHYIGWKALHTCFSCLTWLLLFRLF